MDAYNANPTSMMASLSNFSKIEGENKMLILGDMLELGNQSAEEHQKIVDFLNEVNAEHVFLIGKEFAKTATANKAKKFDNAELLADYLYQLKPLNNQLILIKGSRGIRLEKILDIL